MKIKLLIILTFFAAGCGITSKTSTVPNENKDVFILATIIQDRLRKIDSRDFSINDLKKYDSLRTISINFKKIEFKNRDGFISIYYKFSESRDNKIILTDLEDVMISKVKWTEKKFTDQYDGEIQFDYGERFYRIKKIAIKK